MFRCEKLDSRLDQLMKENQAQISPKKISEYAIIEIAENVCDLKKEETDWMLKIGIVETGNKLQLVEQEEEGIYVCQKVAMLGLLCTMLQITFLRKRST